MYSNRVSDDKVAIAWFVTHIQGSSKNCVTFFNI